MLKTTLLLLRFFIYGLIFFGVSGVVVMLPYGPFDQGSIDVVKSLALSGGARFFIACGAFLILRNILLDMKNGRD